VNYVKNSFKMGPFRVISYSRREMEHMTIVPDGCHSDYVIHGDLSVAASYEFASYLFYRGLAKKSNKINSVLEVFGGSGWESHLIGRVIKPEKHYVLEMYEQGCKSIEENCNPTSVMQVDSYYFCSILKKHFDLIVADFNAFTFRKMEQDRNIKEAVKGMFRSSNKYVKISDSTFFGIYRFPKNITSYDLYLDGHAKDYKHFYSLIQKKFYKLYGFSLIKVIIPKGKTVALLIFKKGKYSNLTFKSVNEKFDMKILRGVS